MYYSMNYEPAMEPWQWLYLFVICFSILPLASGIVADPNRRMAVERLPLWFLFPAALGRLVLLPPWGWVACWMLIVLLFECAPLGAAFVASSFLAFSCVMSLLATFNSSHA